MSGGEIKRVQLRKAKSRLKNDTSLPTVSPPVSSSSTSESVAGGDDSPRPSDHETSKSRYSTYFRPVGGYIDGWIIDQNAADEAVKIDVFVDDIVIATLLADRERPHLKKKFDITSTAHGFRVLVPNRFRDGAFHSISLGVPGSSYRRSAREEFQVPPSEIAPYLDVVAISEGAIDGRVYHGDGQDSPEIWAGATVLRSEDYSVEWGPSEQFFRAFRIRLRNHSTEDLLIRSARISVAHGGASGHAVLLSAFVAPQVVRLSREAVTIGAAIPFPTLDWARCRLELSSSGSFHEHLFSLSVDLSLGVNEVPLPTDLYADPIWARLLLVGGPVPIELLAPTQVPASTQFSALAAGGSVTSASTGSIYVYSPSESSAAHELPQAHDRSLNVVSLDGNGPEARLTVSSDGVGTRPFLRLATNESGSESQLRFVFSGKGLQAGDLLHLRWIQRSSQQQPAITAQGKIALSFSLDGVSSPKLWEETIPPQPHWSDHHSILRLSAAMREMAVELTAPAGCTLDVAGLALGRIANEVDNLPLAPGDVATVELADVFSYPIEQPPPSIAPASYDRFGLLATLGPDGVTGFAWSNRNVRLSTQLQLLVDGEMAGFASAEPVGGFGKGITPGFFSAPLPHPARDGRPHKIDVLFMGTRESVEGAPRALPSTIRHDGAAWLTPAGEIAGWAANANEGAGPLEVEIGVDGRSVARVLADAQHPMFSDPAHNNGRCAFSYALPASIRDGSLHTITVHTTAGIELSGSPILASVKKGRSTLHIDQSSNGWIKGWVATTSPSFSVGVVEVSVNGDHFRYISVDPSHGNNSRKGARLRFAFRLPSHASTVRLYSAELEVDEELAVVRSGEFQKGNSLKELTPTSKYSTAKADFLAAPDQHVDAEWYFAMYPSAAVETAGGSQQSAAEHWLQTGAKRKWSPNAWFDERWYLGRNPDAAAAVEAGEVEAGYLHWLAVGARGWRSPGPAFDPLDFRRAHPLAEDTTADETAFDAVGAWLGELAELKQLDNARAGAKREAPPPDPERSLIRRVVTSRGDRTTMFDTHIGRLLEDLRIAGNPDLDKLRRAFDENEVEIAKRILNYQGLDEPLVSIIMPTFNRAYVIAEGIQSVLDQYWMNWELIVCDDGSLDKTSKIVRQYDDARIRYLQLEKANGAVARNFGIKFARGNYIAFLDSDNIWHPLYLTIAINALRTSLRPAVYTGYIDTNSDGARYKDASIKFAPFDYFSLIARNYIDLNSLVVRRALIDALGEFDETLPRVQDWDLLLRLLRYFDPVEVPCAVAFYRRNPSWGQVTDLAAHTDYTKFVRQRALDRLSIEVASPSPPTQVVSLYVGDSSDTLDTALLFARFLTGVADVLLLINDGAPERKAFGSYALEERIRVVWLRHQDKLRDHLVGSILFVPASYQGAALDGLPCSQCVIGFARHGTSLVIQDRRYSEDKGIALGALRLSTPRDSEVSQRNEAPQGRRRSTVVMTIAPMRQRWVRALLRNRDKVESTLVWREAGQQYSMKVDGERPQAEVVSFDDVLAGIEHHSALILAAGTAENWLYSVSLGIAAQQYGVCLAVGKDDEYEDWVSRKAAFHVPDEPESAVDRLIKILDDQTAVERARTRGRRLFDYLYRQDVMDLRLNTAISLVSRAGDV